MRWLYVLLVAGFLLTLGGCKGDCDKEKTVCSRLGLCTEIDGECRASSDAECEASEGCKLRGACTKTEEGRCAPGSIADCQGSEDCKEQDRCSLLPNGQCDTLRALQRWNEKQSEGSE